MWSQLQIVIELLLCSLVLIQHLVVHSSLVQVYSLVPDVLLQLFGLSHGGREVGMKEICSMDKCALYI